MQVNIKIDDKIYSKLKERAKKNYRTVTGELNLLLREMLEEDDNTLSQPQTIKRKEII